MQLGDSTRVEEQPLAIELMPSADRCSVVVLLRSSNAIPALMLAGALESFANTIRQKTSQKIHVQEKKIVVP